MQLRFFPTGFRCYLRLDMCGVFLFFLLFLINFIISPLSPLFVCSTFHFDEVTIGPNEIQNRMVGYWRSGIDRLYCKLFKLCVSWLLTQRGSTLNRKRGLVLREIHLNNADIVFLQETYFDAKPSFRFVSKYYPCVYSAPTKNRKSAGVAILFGSQIVFNEHTSYIYS